MISPLKMSKSQYERVLVSGPWTGLRMRFPVLDLDCQNKRCHRRA